LVQNRTSLFAISVKQQINTPIVQRSGRLPEGKSVQEMAAQSTSTAKRVPFHCADGYCGRIFPHEYYCLKY